MRRGLQWTDFDEERCVSDKPKKGFRAGYNRIEQKLFAYQAPRLVYLNVSERDNLIGDIIDCPWDEPKVMMNVARIRRGNWRLAAFVDDDKRVCFNGCMPSGRNRVGHDPRS